MFPLYFDLNSSKMICLLLYIKPLHCFLKPKRNCDFRYTKKKTSTCIRKMKDCLRNTKERKCQKSSTISFRSTFYLPRSISCWVC